MTDITDQDRRAAREWAEYIADNPIRPGSHAWMNAVARVILATVDAPDPTLAEGLREHGVWAQGIGAPDHASALNALADRVEQVEQERDDLARARESQEKALHEHGRLLSEARAERDRIATGRHITYAEMDGEPLPDPADVPAGQAWLVEVNGERRAGIRSKNSADYDGEGWSTSPAPMHEWWVEDDRITLVTRLVPAPRVITNPDEAWNLPISTIIRDSRGETFERTEDGWGRISIPAKAIKCPATVLWEPEA